MTNRPIEALAAEMKAAAEAATPGPWLITETESSVSYDPITDEDVDEEDDHSDRTYLTGWQDIGTTEDGPPIVIVTGFRSDLAMTETPIDANAQFIALANPANVLALLASHAAISARLVESEAREGALREAATDAVDSLNFAAVELACSIPDADLSMIIDRAHRLRAALTLQGRG